MTTNEIVKAIDKYWFWVFQYKGYGKRKIPMDGWHRASHKFLINGQVRNLRTKFSNELVKLRDMLDDFNILTLPIYDLGDDYDNIRLQRMVDDVPLRIAVKQVNDCVTEVKLTLFGVGNREAAEEFLK